MKATITIDDLSPCLSTLFNPRHPSQPRTTHQTTLTPTNMTSTVSPTSAYPSPTACFASRVPNLNLTGLEGIVCASSVEPALLNVSPCCAPDTEVRVENDCIQYCEVDRDSIAGSTSTWRRCLEGRSSDVNFELGGFCQEVNGTDSGSTELQSSDGGNDEDAEAQQGNGQQEPGQESVASCKCPMALYDV